MSKDIVDQCAALVDSRPHTPSGEKWTFVKTGGVGKKVKLSDGTEFLFPAIRTNDGSGVSRTSVFETSDEKLAEKLRELAVARRNYIFEVTNK